MIKLSTYKSHIIKDKKSSSSSLGAEDNLKIVESYNYFNLKSWISLIFNKLFKHFFNAESR